MKKQQGFTLIELVVVIVILGILAVVAAPKFINLQGDARLSTLAGMKGAIQSANSLVYSKASLAGVEKAKLNTDLDIGTGQPVYTVYGYVHATNTDLENVLSTEFNHATSSTDPTISVDNNAQWTIYTDGTGDAYIWQRDAPATCRLTYHEAKSTTELPSYDLTTDPTQC
ncbi:prepilin-type N-terminal cleavage/methylation domain-containing protein [Shewanella gaetbuli]